MEAEAPEPNAASGVNAEQSVVDAPVREATGPAHQEAQVSQEAAPGSASGILPQWQLKGLLQ